MVGMEIKKPMTEIHRHPEINLPCDGCTVCCEGKVGAPDLVFLHQEHGDNAQSYQTSSFAMEDGTVKIGIARKPNGECIYLQAGSGCLIHWRRPSVCRYFDCRKFANGELGRRIAVAGKRMIEKTRIKTKKRKVRMK